ncbi:MAG: hypothetical protein QOC81_2064 [Thermoanaerobaculia bacterium]|jgi:hypothetical protein|nr:hypothetical protein [Thermoanaerobaculia bacterium]
MMPLHAEVRAAARAGIFAGSDNHPAGSIELDARYGNWSFAPAYESIQGGYGLHAVHADVRRLFQNEQKTFWIGAGPTFVSSSSSSMTTWNIDTGFEWRAKSRFEPFVAARFYRFRMPVFRDTLKGSGAVISVGVSVGLR